MPSNKAAPSHFSGLSTEHFAVERAVIDGFGDVVKLNCVAVFEVGDGARHFQNAVVATPRKRKLGNRCFEQVFGSCIHLAVVAQPFGFKLGVATESTTLHARRLLFPSRYYP